jgi:hypothetical protein
VCVLNFSLSIVPLTELVGLVLDVDLLTTQIVARRRTDRDIKHWTLNVGFNDSRIIDEE